MEGKPRSKWATNEQEKQVSRSSGKHSSRFPARFSLLLRLRHTRELRACAGGDRRNESCSEELEDRSVGERKQISPRRLTVSPFPPSVNRPPSRNPIPLPYIRHAGEKFLSRSRLTGPVNLSVTISNVSRSFNASRGVKIKMEKNFEECTLWRG